MEDQNYLSICSILQWLKLNTFTKVGKKNITDHRFVDCHTI